MESALKYVLTNANKTGKHITKINVYLQGETIVIKTTFKVFYKIVVLFLYLLSFLMFILLFFCFHFVAVFLALNSIN